VIEDGFNIGTFDPRKPFQKLVNGRPISQIFKQRSDRNTSTTEYQSAAHFIG
jgi:hypothetical protein